MDEIVKTCCFTGPRPKNYPWGRDKECEAKIEEKLKSAVQEAVEMICTPKVGQTLGGAYFYGKKRKQAEKV